MNNQVFRGWVVRTALVYCLLTGVCQKIQSPPMIRFRLLHDTLVVVSVKAGHQGPFDFILDTGAPATVIDRSLADKLALSGSGKSVQVSFAGRQTMVKSSISTIALGEAQVENQRVLIEDLSGLRKIDNRILGIVGQEFLSHFNYLLDYRKRSIQMERGNEIRDAIEGSPIPMERRQNQLIIEAQTNSNHTGVLRLVVDSGATFLVLMPGVARQLGFPTLENRWEQTANDSVAVHAGVVPLLTIGEERLNKIRAVVSAKPTTIFRDGLLPTVLFQAVYFNNREGFLMFNPKTREVARR